MRKTLFILLVTLFPFISHAQTPVKVGKAVLAAEKAATKALPKIPSVSIVNLRPLSPSTEGSVYAATMSNSPAKVALNNKRTYDLERYMAKKLIGQSQQLKLNVEFTPEATEFVFSEVANIRNEALRGFLSQSLKRQHYLTFILDLADYYTIPLEFLSGFELRFIASKDPAERFARSAVDYMARHPHKMNLKFREIMKNPLVEESVKNELRGYVASRKLTPTQKEDLFYLLMDAYKIHIKSLNQAREDVQTAIVTYQEILIRLQDFVARHGRLPGWNYGDQQERLLWNRISVIMYHNTTNNFAEVMKYKEQIQEILESYPKKYITLEETTERLTEYVKEHGTTPSYPKDESTLTYADGLLLESISYWWNNNDAFRSLFESYKNPGSVTPTF